LTTDQTRPDQTRPDQTKPVSALIVVTQHPIDVAALVLIVLCLCSVQNQTNDFAALHLSGERLRLQENAESSAGCFVFFPDWTWTSV